MSFLKWVGGKQQILQELIPYFPKEIKVYYEPFIGGGSVLFHVLDKCDRKEISIDRFVINDINTNLINLYEMIQKNPERLIDCVSILEEKLRELSELKIKEREKVIPPDDVELVKHKKEYYYYIRHQYNLLKKKEKPSDIDKLRNASYFIFLNKVGFRGLYRENSSGEFNVPYGNYKNPNLLNRNLILKISRQLNTYNILFENLPFEQLFKKYTYSNGDFAYLDPPYYPLNKQSFISYSNANFGEKEHLELIDILNSIDNNDAAFLMSNSYIDWVVEHTKKFNSKKIRCGRRINSKNPESQIDEILVWNKESSSKT